MSLIRNNIEIEGVELKDGIDDNSYVLNYWEDGPIFLPKSKGKIRHLNKVIIELNSIEGKVIMTPAGRVLNIYGRKLYYLIYSEKSHDRPQKASIDLPFIAYVYLPKEVEDFSDLDVSVMDAFFEVIDNRKVYSHTLYLIKFNKKEAINPLPSIKQEELTVNPGQLTLEDLERMIIESQLKVSTQNNNLLSQEIEKQLLEKKEDETLIGEGEKDKDIPLLKSENNKESED